MHNALGFAYFNMERPELAIKNYRRAVELQPGYVTAWNNLGDAFEKAKDWDQVRNPVLSHIAHASTLFLSQRHDICPRAHMTQGPKTCSMDARKSCSCPDCHGVVRCMHISICSDMHIHVSIHVHWSFVRCLLKCLRTVSGSEIIVYESCLQKQMWANVHRR